MNVAESIKLQFEDILKETDKAWQIKFSPASVEWIPKSQGRIIGKVLYLAEWFVKDKSLENFKIIKPTE